MSKIRAANFEDTATGGISIPSKYLTQGSLKAWARINVSGGTPSAAASLNVSSVTDTAVGRATPNFTSAFLDANYAGALDTVTTASEDNQGGYFAAASTTSCEIRHYEGATVALTDANPYRIMICGPLA